MAKYTDPLSRVRIAAPCHADWATMTGTERARFCSACNLHVYNLTAMTRTEAERLVLESEGRLCVRFYRRPDGTILTQNCPVGVQRLKQRAMRFATATLSAVFAFFAGLGINAGHLFGKEVTRIYTMPEPRLEEPLEEQVETSEMGFYVEMGEAIAKPAANYEDVGIYANGRVVLGTWDDAAAQTKESGAAGKARSSGRARRAASR